MSVFIQPCTSYSWPTSLLQTFTLSCQNVKMTTNTEMAVLSSYFWILYVLSFLSSFPQFKNVTHQRQHMLRKDLLKCCQSCGSDFNQIGNGEDEVFDKLAHFVLKLVHLKPLSNIENLEKFFKSFFLIMFVFFVCFNKMFDKG